MWNEESSSLFSGRAKALDRHSVTRSQLQTYETLMAAQPLCSIEQEESYNLNSRSSNQPVLYESEMQPWSTAMLLEPDALIRSIPSILSPGPLSIRDLSSQSRPQGLEPQTPSLTDSTFTTAPYSPRSPLFTCNTLRSGDMHSHSNDPLTAERHAHRQLHGQTLRYVLAQ